METIWRLWGLPTYLYGVHLHLDTKWIHLDFPSTDYRFLCSVWQVQLSGRFLATVLLLLSTTQAGISWRLADFKLHPVSMSSRSMYFEYIGTSIHCYRLRVGGDPSWAIYGH